MRVYAPKPGISLRRELMMRGAISVLSPMMLNKDLPLLERKADDEDILVRYFSGVLRQAGISV